jgi:hypothetical protein
VSHGGSSVTASIASQMSSVLLGLRLGLGLGSGLGSGLEIRSVLDDLCTKATSWKKEPGPGLTVSTWVGSGLVKAGLR